MYVKGVGPARAAMLETKGLKTVEDLLTYAPFRYEDRSSMAFGIETRLPFLDYRLVEFAFSLPDTARLEGTTTKAIARRALGDRLYGCDDCQLICPWNRFAQTSSEVDFAVRNGLDEATLADLFGWSANDFDDRLRGSAIHRIGHERWLRNIAVGLGNVPAGSTGAEAALTALRARADDASALVREHVAWAIRRLTGS